MSSDVLSQIGGVCTVNILPCGDDETIHNIMVDENIKVVEPYNEGINFDIQANSNEECLFQIYNLIGEKIGVVKNLKALHNLNLANGIYLYSSCNDNNNLKKYYYSEH